MAAARVTRCLYLFGPPASALQALSKDKKVRDKFFADFKLDCSAFDALASLDDKSALQEQIYRHCLNTTNTTYPPTRFFLLKAFFFVVKQVMSKHCLHEAPPLPQDLLQADASWDYTINICHQQGAHLLFTHQVQWGHQNHCHGGGTRGSQELQAEQAGQAVPKARVRHPAVL